MRTGLLDGLLKQLQREGVEHIRFVHFEGRGDPLMNSRLSDLIELSKAHFPRSIVGVTTHGSYPYMPWIAHSGLDLLRVSIDGATSASYAKYRVGGDFERALEFLRKLRDDRIRTGSALRVEWKYILFQWNDSPEEMKRATELAKELDAQLTFVRTHSSGHSWRFRTDSDLREYVRRFLPHCNVDETFQLKSAGEAAAPALLSLAIERIRAGDTFNASRHLCEALRYDPALSIDEMTNIGEGVRGALPQILARARFPSTLSWLAGVSREVGDWETSDALLSRYLEVAPNAPDRKHVLLERVVRTAVQHAERNEFHLAHARFREAVCVEFGIVTDGNGSGHPILFHMDRILRSDCSPLIAVCAANIALAEKKFPAAGSLFRKYLQVAPEAADRERVERIIADIEGHVEFETAHSTLWRRTMALFRQVVS